MDDEEPAGEQESPPEITFSGGVTLRAPGAGNTEGG